MKREFKVAFNTGSDSIREAEAFKDGMKSIFNDVGVVPYCSEYLKAYFQLGRKLMIEKVMENTSLMDEVISIECSIEEGDYYWCVAIVTVVINDENSEAVRPGKVIVNCPYRERELVEAFIRGVESGRLCGGFSNLEENVSKAIAFDRGLNLSRHLLNTDFVVRWRDCEGVNQEKELKIK